MSETAPVALEIGPTVKKLLLDVKGLDLCAAVYALKYAAEEVQNVGFRLSKSTAYMPSTEDLKQFDDEPCKEANRGEV